MARITVGDLENIKAKLHEAPKQDGRTKSVTKQQAILELRDEIADMLDRRNYTYQQVAEYLGLAGMTLSPEALRSYMLRAGYRTRKRKPKSQPVRREPEQVQDALSSGLREEEARIKKGSHLGSNKTRAGETRDTSERRAGWNSHKPVKSNPPGGFTVREDSEVL